VRSQPGGQLLGVYGQFGEASEGVGHLCIRRRGRGCEVFALASRNIREQARQVIPTLSQRTVHLLPPWPELLSSGVATADGHHGELGTRPKAHRDERPRRVGWDGDAPQVHGEPVGPGVAVHRDPSGGADEVGLPEPR
jgi:hypothetical protein